jgi:hypothetical protein
MREIFDPNGNATVILLATHFRSNLPRLSTLKARLKVRAAAHYQVHSKQGSLLRSLLSMRHELHHIKSQGLSGPAVHPTDFVLLSGHVYTNDLFRIDFEGSLLDGFWVTRQSLSALDDVLRILWDMQSAQRVVQQGVTALVDSFKSAANDLGEAKLVDPTIETPPINDLRQLLDGYGDQAIAQANQAVIDWYEAHCWKDRSQRPKSESNFSGPGFDVQSDALRDASLIQSAA